ncbi:hypothetical protein C1645_831310 [Glomus cerebriforme]|uniref:Pentacotripeptide-repeat region of PRORP domain-containing protein n=1 Tax=Glomus cerebriforme TaxID=658196 RepID=A0A397SGE9_9GLOM|nr:hypothetical protein C1645_831310 [Glomus cerebriforme]
MTTYTKKSFLFIRLKLYENFIKFSYPNSIKKSKCKFSTNIIKFDQNSTTKEEKELYLRLTKTFREKLKSDYNKPELYYDNLIKTTIFETSKIFEKPNPVEKIFKIEEIKKLLVNMIIFSNNHNKLKELYQDFKKLEITNELVYRRFILYFIKDDVKKSKEIYQDMRNNGIIPSISYLTLLIKITKDITTKDYFIKEIKDLGLQFNTKNQFHVLLNYYISKKDVQGVQSLWQEMRKMLNIIDFKQIDSYSYLKYIGFLIENNLLDKAIETIHIMENEGIQPLQRTFVDSVIKPLAMNDYPQLAWRLLSSYQKISSNFSSYDYTYILEAFMRQNDFNSIRKVFINMKLLGINPDNKSKEILEKIKDHSIIKEEILYREYELIPILKTIFILFLDQKNKLFI